MAEVLLRRVGLRSLEEALESFLASSERFRVVRSCGSQVQDSVKPETLFILDSSYNPPSKAHLALATSALTAGQNSTSYPKPHRLLLLFSTHNADKTVKSDIFIERLAMMSLFADDLVSDLQESHPQLAKVVGVDVGLTTTPYYTDKSVAIASTNQYPDRPKHVHVVGYDTLIRIVNPKYYPGHSPPLSALAPYFVGGHGFLITQRPFDPSDESSKGFGTEEEQTKFLDELRRGGKEELGFKSEWAQQIQMLPPGEGQGVSSSRIRAAVKAGRWDEATKLCTPSVLEWVKLRQLYKP